MPRTYIVREEGGHPFFYVACRSASVWSKKMHDFLSQLVARFCFIRVAVITQMDRYMLPLRTAGKPDLGSSAPDLDTKYRPALIACTESLFSPIVPRDNQGETAYCLIRRCSQTLMPLPH